MKPDDVKFLREIRARINPAYAGVAGTASYDRTRLLALLYESEGMREELEFKRDHQTEYFDYGLQYCRTCDSQREPGGQWKPKRDKRHEWRLLDWIAAVRKEIEG